jgi:hypothetical protein
MVAIDGIGIEARIVLPLGVPAVDPILRDVARAEVFPSVTLEFFGSVNWTMGSLG